MYGDEFDSGAVSVQRADARAGVEKSRWNAQQWRAAQAESEMRKKEDARRRDFNYFLKCAEEIFPPSSGIVLPAEEMREIAEGLRYIHDSQLVPRKAKWLEDEMGQFHFFNKSLFRDEYFHPMVIENLKVDPAGFLKHFREEKAEAAKKGEKFKSANCVYDCMLRNILKPVGLEGRFWEIRNELCSPGRPTPRPVYNLSEGQVLKCLAKHDPRINVDATKLAPREEGMVRHERELYHMGKEEPVKKDSSSPPKKKPVQVKFF